jgi:hypothetical protein
MVGRKRMKKGGGGSFEKEDEGKAERKKEESLHRFQFCDAITDYGSYI